MRGEYQTRQKREMTRFLAEHAMQGFTPEELAHGPWRRRARASA